MAGSNGKGKNVTWIVIGVAVLFLFFLGCSSYNSMVGLDEDVNQAWANVESQYQRRADLIPNLVNTVKGYAEHEKSTFEAVTNARAGLTEALDQAKDLKADENSDESMNAYYEAQTKLKGALDLYINAVHEAYPDLKANQNFSDLQAQLEGTENRINAARNRYNAVVREYNTNIRQFPGKIWAVMFGFEPRASFEADKGAENAPKVEF